MINELNDRIQMRTITIFGKHFKTLLDSMNSVNCERDMEAIIHIYVCVSFIPNGHMSNILTINKRPTARMLKM